MAFFFSLSKLFGHFRVYLKGHGILTQEVGTSHYKQKQTNICFDPGLESQFVEIGKNWSFWYGYSNHQWFARNMVCKNLPFLIVAEGQAGTHRPDGPPLKYRQTSEPTSFLRSVVLRDTKQNFLVHTRV